MSVKPHECQTKRPFDTRPTQFLKRKMMKDENPLYMFTPEDNVKTEYMDNWSPYCETFYKCDCTSGIVKIYPGYISCLDIEKYPYFGPYEYQRDESFYFGCYSKFARISKFVEILRDCTSDCDGCYGDAGFLEVLRAQLERAKYQDPTLEEYFALLEGKDLSNCIVKHC